MVRSEDSQGLLRTHPHPLQNLQTCHHECEVKPLLDGLAVQLVGKGCETHILLVLLVGDI